MSEGRSDSASPIKRLEVAVEGCEELVEEVLFDVEGDPANSAKDRRLGLTMIRNLRRLLAMGIKFFTEANQVLAEVKEDLEQERMEGEDRSNRTDGDELAREREEARKDVRTVLEAEERRRAMRQEDVLLALTVISVLATITLAFITVKHREPWYLGASLVAALLSGGGVFFLRAERPREA